MNITLPTSSAQKTARWHYERGRALYQAGQYRKAATAFRRAIRRAPGMPLAYVGRGLSLVRLSRHQRAVRNIEKALALSAESGRFESTTWLLQAAYEGARAYERLGQLYMALRLYTKVIESAPDELTAETISETYRHRGRVHLRLKHYRPALSDLNHALDVAPNKAIAFLNRATVYAELGRQDKAINDLHKFLELADPEDPHWVQAQAQLAALNETPPSGS